MYTQHGWIQHSKAGSSIDPSGARENHGDRPTADALLWKAMKMRRAPMEKKGKEIIDGSFAYRRQNVEDRKNKMELW